MERLVGGALGNRDKRMAGYRAQSLNIHPWVCARCGRAFDQSNITELTVHHKDHNHDNNPSDGSNWENLCIYCHDNEHARQVEYQQSEGISTGKEEQGAAKYNPFENLKELLGKK
ncbi:MAG: HNH nuclease family protein [Magnetococcales bacterium]|nr:HNH nuclease family protein [Magnetococcales bacterium]MBF0151476.1 HNH nuclease family protein [Magnetococcales bacterium]MBF0173107.1 HNH nuclease family protein [Magnetococcales bacterium]MBF0346242.1 HNH nuclease family protein [Magnetococcales bacterium]MBF0632531.1 HNH nuclease family protein [Magnetococcales bacterium]